MSETARGRGRRRPSVLRNLFILSGVILVFAIVAVAARFVQGNARLISPESFNAQEDAALRMSPENAYHVLVEANGLMRPWPGPLQDLRRNANEELMDTRWPRFKLETDLSFDVFKEVQDESIKAWFDEIGPAMDKMHEASVRSYYRMPQAIFINRDTPEFFRDLVLAALAQGVWRARHTGEFEAGLARLLDCARVARLLCLEDSYFRRPSGLEEEVYRQLVLLLADGLSEKQMEQILSSLTALGMPWSDRKAALEQFWQQIDISLAVGVRSGEGLRALLFTREVQFTADRVRNNRDFYARLAEGPLSMHEKLFSERADLSDEDWHFEGRRRGDRNSSVLMRVCYTQLHYCRALMAAVLARYQLQHGSYPASLETAFSDAGVALPMDPVGVMPWGYRSEGAGYVLYTTWRDGVDQGGAEGGDLVLLRKES